MNNIALLLFFVAVTSFGQETYQDTIYYKSGYERPCKITFFDSETIEYSYTNSKGLSKSSKVKRKTTKYFVRYQEGQKTYDSRKDSGQINSGEVHTEVIKYNDTIYFDESKFEVVYITKYSPKQIFYNIKTDKGGIDHTSVSAKKVLRYVIYNEEDKLIYDSTDQGK